jgi:hypothetical protein
MGARCRLSVDIGYVGVEGERDVIDKQGAALVRLLDPEVRWPARA